MLDIRFIRTHIDQIKEAARQKGINVDIDHLLSVDDRRRELLQEVEILKQRRNENSRRMPSLPPDDRMRLREETRRLGEQIREIEMELVSVLEEFHALMLLIPNPPTPDTPVGDETANREIKRVGDPPKFTFPPKNHVELMLLHDMLDVERGVKVAGSRSYFLKNDGVLLHLAVLRLALDLLRERGYTIMYVPVLVNSFAMEGTGYFPLGREQAYHIPEDEKYLVGTAEVSLVAYHTEEILREEDLPLRYAGISEAFRREVGSAGRDTFGLYRVHQFSKVEQVILAPADEELSLQLHMELLENAEELVRRLELPYRVVQIATGDMGQGQVRKHDIETWMPSRETYGETHSCSTFHDFQARRLKIRYRKFDGSLAYAYTLNNTAIASPRILIALLENHQQEDGRIRIPEILRPYLGGKSYIG